MMRDEFYEEILEAFEDWFFLGIDGEERNKLRRELDYIDGLRTWQAACSWVQSGGY